MRLMTKLALTLVLLLGVTLSFSNSKGEGRYIAQAVSIYKHHSLDIDLFRWVIVEDASYHEGHYYPPTPPAIALLMLPSVVVGDLVYQVLPNSAQDKLKEAMRHNYMTTVDGASLQFHLSEHELDLESFAVYQLSSIVARVEMIALTLLFFFGCVRFFQTLPWKVEVDVYPWVGFFCIAATFLLYYGNKVFWHIPVAACIVWSLALLHKNPSPRGLFFAGFFASLIACVDYSSGLYGVAIIVYGLWLLRKDRQNIMLLFAGCIIPSCLFMGYHVFVFEGPFTIAHAYILNQNHVAGFYGLDVGLKTFPNAFELLFTLDLGYLFYALFAVPGIVALYKLYFIPDYKPLAILIIFILFVALLVNTSFTLDLRGGFAWGPRYLGVAVPLMAIGAVWLCSFIPRKVSILLLLLSCLCVMVHFLALSMDNTFAIYSAVNEVHYNFSSLFQIIQEHGLTFPLFATLENKGALDESASLVATLVAYSMMLLLLALIWFSNRCQKRSALN